MWTSADSPAFRRRAKSSQAFASIDSNDSVRSTPAMIRPTQRRRNTASTDSPIFRSRSNSKVDSMASPKKAGSPFDILRAVADQLMRSESEDGRGRTESESSQQSPSESVRQNLYHQNTDAKRNSKQAWIIQKSNLPSIAVGVGGGRGRTESESSQQSPSESVQVQLYHQNADPKRNSKQAWIIQNQKSLPPPAPNARRYSFHQILEAKKEDSPCDITSSSGRNSIVSEIQVGEPAEYSVVRRKSECGALLGLPLGSPGLQAHLQAIADASTILVMGAQQSGKSAVIDALKFQERFEEKMAEKRNVRHYIEIHSDQDDLWRTLSGVVGILVVFLADREKSFRAAQEMLQILHSSSITTPLILVATKCESKSKSVISSAEKLCRRMGGVEMVEVSARLHTNVAGLSAMLKQLASPNAPLPPVPAQPNRPLSSRFRRTSKGSLLLLAGSRQVGNVSFTGELGREERRSGRALLHVGAWE